MPVGAAVDNDRAMRSIDVDVVVVRGGVGYGIDVIAVTDIVGVCGRVRYLDNMPTVVSTIVARVVSAVMAVAVMAVVPTAISAEAKLGVCISGRQKQAGDCPNNGNRSNRYSRHRFGSSS